MVWIYWAKSRRASLETHLPWPSRALQLQERATAGKTPSSDMSSTTSPPADPGGRIPAAGKQPQFLSSPTKPTHASAGSECQPSMPCAHSCAMFTGVGGRGLSGKPMEAEEIRELILKAPVTVQSPAAAAEQGPGLGGVAAPTPISSSRLATRHCYHRQPPRARQAEPQATPYVPKPYLSHHPSL